MSSPQTAIVILAAGKGTRMRSDKPKVLHAVAWRPMIAHVVDATIPLGAARRVLVIGHGGEAVRASALAEDATLTVAEQREQKGTGHAVLQAKEALAGFSGTVLVVPGDVPLVRAETLAALVKHHEASGAPVTVLTSRPADATGYGRIVREAGSGDRIAKIVEHRDASETEKAIGEINTGFIAARADFLFSALGEITPANAQKELYLTDIVAIAAKRGTPAAARTAEDATELEGINDRVQLATQEAALFKRVARAHMLEGVTILHPGSVRIDPRAKIGADTVIHPRVEVRGNTMLGRECVIDTGSVIDDSTLGDGVTVKPYCVIHQARAAAGCIIGPFANLRPEAELAEGVHVGNFVEVKKSTIGKGSKANHLAYLGDATIGAGVNVGAGTITCNYDGFLKHRTVIEDGVFIGSDTQLVAPVTVGKDAIVGAGTTVTEDVAPGALALTRPEQKQVPGFAARFRAKGEKAKAASKKKEA